MNFPSVHKNSKALLRGNFDLTQHQEVSGKKLEYIDEETKEKYLPHVIEPSAGVDRIALALLCEAYREEWIPKGGGKSSPLNPTPSAPRRVRSTNGSRFCSRIAPYKAAILPLVKNKEPLVEKARELYEQLSKRWTCFYDQNGAIGRRYRRQDEIGTLFALPSTLRPLKRMTATVRDRDTMQQVRISICELEAFIAERVDF